MIRRFERLAGSDGRILQRTKGKPAGRRRGIGRIGIRKADLIHANPAIAIIDDLDVSAMTEVAADILRLAMPDELPFRIDGKCRAGEEERAELVHDVAVDDQADLCVLAGQVIEDLRARDGEGG